jgi:hypothetical protein
MLRKTELLSEFCGLDDFRYIPKKYRENDPLRNFESDEATLIQRQGLAPFNRSIPFDIDDDIVILPNFMSRQANTALVFHSYSLSKILAATSS